MIYPAVQSFGLTGEPLVSGIPAFTAAGDYAERAVRFFENRFPSRDGGSRVNLTIVTDSSRALRYIEKTHKISNEIYELTVSPADGGAEIAVRISSGRGLFRALCTVSKLIEAGELCEGKIRDYPLFEKRGYIEGFYGKTWEHSSRLSVMSLMAYHGMNSFYYAPKDDIYHREKWREQYPEDEIKKLKELVDFAGENELDFYYCIAPGLTMRYTSEEDFAALKMKLLSVYSIGVTRFGLLLDDIPELLQYPDDIERYGETVVAHTELINRLFSELRSLDPRITLTVCPLEYHGDGNEYFISRLGNDIPREVDIFYTGSEICSRVITCNEAVRFAESVRHKPLYWDNFPVNDAEMLNEMHIGPIKGRDRELYKYSRGLISNVMEYAECSKIPLLTICDYLWNPEGYDCDASYRYALETVLGKENAETFAVFSDHLQTSCLGKESSVYMSEVLSQARFLIMRHDSVGAFALIADYIEKVSACNNMLSDTSVPIFRELSRWAEKLRECEELLRLGLEVAATGEDSEREQLIKMSEAYHREATVLTGFCLREFTEAVCSL